MTDNSPLPSSRRAARELATAKGAPAAQVTVVILPPPPKGKRSKVKLRKALRKQARTKSSAGSKFLSLGALLFAGALLVGMSVPANAFITGASPLPTASPMKLDGQSIEVSDEAAFSTPARDGFTVTSYAEMLRLKYASMPATYTTTTGAIRWPFPYAVTITDRFGNRPNGTSGYSHHNGVDFTPGNGTPIYAIAAGTVSVHSDDAYGYGNHVILSHNVNGMVFDSLYAHMQTGTSPLNAGDVVEVGDFIGLVGDTGESYGAHLHLEIRIGGSPVDPFAWLQANAVN